MQYVVEGPFKVIAPLGVHSYGAWFYVYVEFKGILNEGLRLTLRISKPTQKIFCAFHGGPFRVAKVDLVYGITGRKS